MGWKIYDEAVDMLGLRYRYLPHSFRWRGQRFTVQAVDRIWTVSRRHVQRRFYQVHCGDGVYELYHDLRDNTWHLRRGRLAPAPVGAARRILPAWR